jgi:hypothetical protein
MGVLEALPGLADAPHRYGRVEGHHALDDVRRAAHQARVVAHHRLDVPRDARQVHCQLEGGGNQLSL